MRVEQRAAQAGISEPVIPAFTRLLATAHVLVVCGNTRLQKRIAGCLQDGNHNIRATVLGESESVGQALAREAVDLLIVELSQPVQEGLQVVRRLRTRTKLPIIALVPADDAINRAIVFEAGADDCMLRSFAPQELVARTRALLRRRAMPGKPAVEPAAEMAAVLRQVLNVYLRM